jgi:NAD(P)H-flavin reductase
MVTLNYKQQDYICKKNETVLDTLLRENNNIAHGCRQGVCQSCIMRSVDTNPPAIAQQGLQENQKQQKHFLSCLCLPEQNMQIEQIEHSEFTHNLKVLSKQMLNHDTLLLRLLHDELFAFKAGQFINLKSTDNTVRSYSISNPPNKQLHIELQIRLLPKGRFSGWIHNEVKIGDNIPASLALGCCFYNTTQQEQGLLLVGTGSGLAPLYGILQDALQQKHKGEIHLFHGSRQAEGVYLKKQIQQLVNENNNLSYTACISGEYKDEHKTHYSQGRVHNVALSSYPSLNNWRVYLCGHPEMVKQMQTQVFLKGVDMNDIYVDAFHSSSL